MWFRLHWEVSRSNIDGVTHLHTCSPLEIPLQLREGTTLVHSKKYVA
jgi:hypothetical protein